jgi:putative membrane protein
MNEGSDDPAALRNELAKERNRAGADRTLMAWIRTSLALITFGFGIDKILAAINHGNLGNRSSVGLGVNIVAVGFILIGIASLIAALVEHRSILRRVHQSDFVYTERRSIVGMTAVMIVLVGAFALVTILRG